MAYETIDYTVDEGIAKVTLDRPAVLNAFDVQMLDELNDALYTAHASESVFVVILTGRGRGFCSGADVSNMEDRDDRETKTEYGAHVWKVQNVVKQLYMGRKPVVGAVNGPAVGAGCDFALACDLRILSDDAVLREQFVNIGLVPGDGGGWLLPRLVGESKAKELLLTGRDVTAQEASDLGLAVDVVAKDQLSSAARDLAMELRDKPTTSMQRTKSLIDTSQSFEEYSRAAFEAQWECIRDPEHEEAVRALQEGREPSFDRES